MILDTEVMSKMYSKMNKLFGTYLIIASNYINEIFF